MVETLRYEKLASDLAALITDGLILQGERLPSVRRLAQERRLSVSTVIQALRQLEDRGLVEARPQSGYFVCHRRLQLAEPETRSPPVAAMPVDISQRLLRGRPCKSLEMQINRRFSQEIHPAKSLRN